MLGWRIVHSEPAHGPDKSCSTGNEKCPTPIKAEHNRRNHGGGNCGTEARSCITYSKSKRSFSIREPLGDSFSCGGKAPPLAEAQKEKPNSQAKYARNRPLHYVGCRPPDNNGKITPSYSQRVCELTANDIHHTIRKQEHELQIAVLLICDRYGLLNFPNHNGQRLPVNIGKRAGSSEQTGDPPTEVRNAFSEQVASCPGTVERSLRCVFPFQKNRDSLCDSAGFG